jgi:CheY-like chemotaxis protein
VRHLVELHGGTIKAESAGEAQGATFTIKLPLAPSPERARQRRKVSRSSKPGEDSKGQFASLPSLDDVQVLLVDDDADTLQILSVMLADSKATFQTAASVSEALEVLEWYEPDVVVSDLAMPGQDGYSLIRQLRALEAKNGTQIPTVALTSHARVEDRTRALSAGFNMFVPKPVQPDEIIAAIAKLTEAAG